MKTPESTKIISGREAAVRIFLHLLVGLLIVGQTCHKPVAGDRPRSALILVPGFKGTALAAGDHRRVWITTREALFGDSTLALPVPGIEVQDVQPLVPDGLLKRIAIVPGLIGVDVYQSLIEFLRSETGTSVTVVEFPYDWRREPVAIAGELAATVQQLRSEGVQSITLFGHSAGGLIVSYFLRYGAQDLDRAEERWQGAEAVNRVILAGVPFLGAMKIFRDMQVGDAVLFNRRLLSAEALSTFPMSYHLLPPSSTRAVVDEHAQPVEDLLHQAAAWKQHRWGLFQRGSRTDLEEDAMVDFVAGHLDRAAKFSRLLGAPLRSSPSVKRTLLVLVGTGRPTLARAVLQRRDGKLLFDGNGLLLEDGDGVVPVDSAAVPTAFQEAFRASVLSQEAAHERLWSSNQVKTALREFLAKQ